MKHFIIVYTHNRSLYLRQTMDSLIYSLNGDTSNIVVVLQDADESTQKLVKRYKVDVLETGDNCVFAGMTIAIRWYEPDVISIVQDDHILPPMTRVIHQSWPYEFESMLDKGDLVMFGVSMSNLPCKMPFPIYQPSREDDKFEYFDDPANSPPIFLFQPCTMRREFWEKCYSTGPRTAVDSTVLIQAKRIVRAKLETYHIGWCSAMNGYDNREDWKRGFNLPIDKTIVTQWSTKEVREINL